MGTSRPGQTLRIRKSGLPPSCWDMGCVGIHGHPVFFQSSHWQAQQKLAASQEEDAWDQLLGKDLIGLLSEQGPGKGAPAKGNGKGKAKSKTKSQPPQPALEDMTTEEQLHEGLKKMKKT